MSEGRFICLGVGGVKGTVRVSYISYRKHCFEKVKLLFGTAFFVEWKISYLHLLI